MSSNIYKKNVIDTKVKSIDNPVIRQNLGLFKSSKEKLESELQK